MPGAQPSTGQKALQINLEARHYGAFAEIGAGQEVARWFFSVGGASGTVAKTISAYDMAISDAIYGATGISLRQPAAARRHARSRVPASGGAPRPNPRRQNHILCLRQHRRHARPETPRGRWLAGHSLPDRTARALVGNPDSCAHARQRERPSTGSARCHRRQPYSWRALLLAATCHALIASLLDNLTWERIEVDLIQFSGAAFSHVDNRLMALELVKQDLTEAAMFTARREPIQWAEVFYKKPVLALRGSFYPFTNATLDLLERAQEQFAGSPLVAGETPVTLLEMTLRHLNTGEFINEKDFLERADMLAGLGKPVLISNFLRFHRLAGYLSNYTQRPIALALGASRLREIFDASLYNVSEGGLLGGLGQLFKNPGRLYVYPTIDNGTGGILTADSFQAPPGLEHLYAYLLKNGFIEGIRHYNKDLLPIRSTDILRRIKSGDASWEKLVPAPVVEIIKRDGLCGAPKERSPEIFEGPLLG